MYKYFDEIWAGSDFVPRGYFLYVPEFIDNARSFQYKETSEYKEIDKVLNYYCKKLSTMQYLMSTNMQ